MDDSVMKARAALDRVCETPSATGPVALDPAYLRAIEILELDPCNQTGSDKSWVRHCLEADVRSWREAKRIDMPS